MKNKKNKRKKNTYSAIPPRFRHVSPIAIAKHILRSVKYSIQRIRYGYCDMDTWGIDDWFLHVVPNMLNELRANCTGYPANIEGETEEERIKNWDKILNRMEFLLREANEDTCEKKNPYEKEYRKCQEEFRNKYGVFGEKLKTKEEKEEERKSGCRISHSMAAAPEYQKVCKKYFEAEKKLDNYRNDCLHEGLELFRKWFWNLWD